MNRFEKWSVWIASVLVAATGVGLLWTRYLMRARDPWSVINHPLEPWFLKAHIITAPLLIFAIGLIATRHIWPHFKAGIRRGRRSGILTGLLTLPMILTGYLIQVVTHAAWLRALAMSHIVLGLVFASGLAVHQVVTHVRGRPRRSRPRSRGAERHGLGDRSAARSTPSDTEIFA